MGYIYIIISVFFNAAKGYSSKRVSSSLATLYRNMSFNVVRLLITCIFALLFTLFRGIYDIFSPSFAELAVCAAAGIAMSVFTCVWQLAVRSKAYMLVSACSSASFVVPVLCGLLLWDENFTLPGILAFVLVVIALFFLLRYDFRLNGKISIREAILLVSVLVSQGVMQCTQKLYSIYAPDKDSSLYTFYMFFFAFCTSIAVLALFKRSENEKARNIFSGNIKYMLVMSGALFAASFFQTLAAKSVDAVILYPILSGLSLAAGSTMSALFFKEKLTYNSIIGIILVFCSLVLSRF